MQEKTQQVRQNNNFEVYKLWVKFLKCGQGKNHLQVIVAQQVIYCYWIYLYRVHTRSVLKYFFTTRSVPNQRLKGPTRSALVLCCASKYFMGTTNIIMDHNVVFD